jgi:hypothetical protein
MFAVGYGTHKMYPTCIRNTGPAITGLGSGLGLWSEGCMHALLERTSGNPLHQHILPECWKRLDRNALTTLALGILHERFNTAMN